MFCFLLDRPLLFLSTVIFPLCHLLWHISAHGLLIRIKTVLKRMSWVVCHLKGFFLRYLSRLSIMLWDAPFITQWVNDRSYLWITYSLCGPNIRNLAYFLSFSIHKFYCVYFGAFLCTILSGALFALRTPKQMLSSMYIWLHIIESN